MNERIKQLAIQAGAEHFIGENSHLPIGRLDKEGIEKFAELIVEEVYDYILNATFDDEPWPSCKDVKQHFGVEE